jgi:DNA-binding beta-propeller fold protein YncE/mannose-6-phosphate isomerase-like protein (cupin superfamily)
MTRTLLAVAIVFVASIAGTAQQTADTAQQPILWSAKQLADLEQKISSNVDPARHLGLERLIDGGATLIYRDGPSEAEIHTKHADLITIRSGEGEVLIGGTIVEGRSTAADELRGKAIQGGTSYKVSAGDILYIPANTVHQFMLAPGKHFIVTIVKITPSAAPAQAPAPAPRAGNAAPRNDLPQPYRTTRDWGELPAGMKWPAVTAVEPAPDGSIYVVARCFENSCAGRSEPPILKYNKDGKLLATFGQNMFNFPHGATVDREGNLWVTDARGGNGRGHQVFKFSPQGKVLMTLGKAGVAGSGPGLFDQPTDVVVAANGDIFVTDSHRTTNGPPALNNRVVKFTRDGRFVKEWGKKGSGPGELSEPHTIAMDSRGRLFVGDRENNRIQIFDQDGQLIDEWRQFGRPSGIFITPDDTIYVADSESGPDTGARELPGIKKGIRIGSARDGRVTAFIEDMESTRDDHSGAEGVGVDADGNVYGAVVRRQMLEKHVRK